MTILTPLRILRAVGTPLGRRQYRLALRERVWRGLGLLPFPLRFNARLSGSLRIRISSQDPVISRSIFVCGEWEPFELDFIRGYLKPGMVAFDVGANIGAHTLTMAKCVGPEGRVHAFEPTGVFDTLSYNVSQNGFGAQVVLNNCAVGAEDGTTRLLACKPGFELFTSRGIPLVPEASTGEYVDYPVTTLDSYARARGIGRIDFLKVDVEGAEDLVLQGAKQLLARRAIECIMFEFNEVCMAENGDSPSSIIHRIESAGYHLIAVDRAGQVFPIFDGMTGVFNIIATRQPAETLP